MTEFLFYHLQAQPVERVLPVLLERSVERPYRLAITASHETVRPAATSDIRDAA